MWKNAKTVAAFTLLECLVALLVLSGSLLVFEGLTRVLAQEVHYQSSNSQMAWLVFTEQFRRELEDTTFVKIENNRLYVNKQGQALAFGLARGGDFRKTNDRGLGYQPMLQGLELVSVIPEGKNVRLDFRFADGLERTFVYAFTADY